MGGTQRSAETCSYVPSCKVPFYRSECQGRLKALLRGSRTWLAPYQASSKAEASQQMDKYPIRPVFVRGSIKAKEKYAESGCHIFLHRQDEYHFLATGPRPETSLWTTVDKQKRGQRVIGWEKRGCQGPQRLGVKVGLKLGLINLTGPSLHDFFWAPWIQPLTWTNARRGIFHPANKCCWTLEPSTGCNDYGNYSDIDSFWPQEPQRWDTERKRARAIRKYFQELACEQDSLKDG